MMKKNRSYSSWRLEKLADPDRAARYLTAALNDSTEAFLHAFKNVLQAREVSTVAKKAGVTRESLYRSFSKEGNPTLETLKAVLHAIDLKLTKIEPQAGSSLSPIDLPPERAISARIRSRKNRPRRGIGGISQAQLSLPFDIGPSTVARETSPINTGIRVGIAQKQWQSEGSGILLVPMHPSEAPHFIGLPGFFASRASQNESAAVSVLE
jgi:probable addiction module antidote protein